MHFFKEHHVHIGLFEPDPHELHLSAYVDYHIGGRHRLCYDCGESRSPYAHFKHRHKQQIENHIEKARYDEGVKCRPAVSQSPYHAAVKAVKQGEDKSQSHRVQIFGRPVPYLNGSAQHIEYKVLSHHYEHGRKNYHYRHYYDDRRGEPLHLVMFFGAVKMGKLYAVSRHEAEGYKRRAVGYRGGSSQRGDGVAPYEVAHYHGVDYRIGLLQKPRADEGQGKFPQGGKYAALGYGVFFAHTFPPRIF